MRDYKIISLADFGDYQDITSNLNEMERLDPAIFDAQQLDLEPFLGSELYHSFVAGLQTSPPEQRFLDLLNGKVYTPSYTTSSIRFFGVKPALINLTLTRFVENQDVFFTRLGVKYKNSEESTQVPIERKNALSNSYKSKAAVFLQGVKSFLNESKSVYPEWKNCSHHSEVNSIRILTVKKRSF